MQTPLSNDMPEHGARARPVAIAAGAALIVAAIAAWSDWRLREPGLRARTLARLR